MRAKDAKMLANSQENAGQILSNTLYGIYAIEVVPVELTVRPVRLAHLFRRVLGASAGAPITLVNYTKNGYGFHFDTLRILGDDPILKEAEAKLLKAHISEPDSSCISGAMLLFLDCQCAYGKCQ